MQYNFTLSSGGYHQKLQRLPYLPWCHPKICYEIVPPMFVGTKLL